MKKALIITNAYAPAKSRQADRLKSELSLRGVDVEVKRNVLLPEVGESAPDIAYDFCVYLDKDKYVSALLEKAGLRLFNSARAIELCDDKMTTHIELMHKVPMPQTVPGLLCYEPTAPLDTDAIDRVIKRLGLPLVIKSSYGSLGNGVFLARTRKETLKIAEQLKTSPHLFQKYIAPSHGKDMRVIVIGGEVIGGMLRISNGDFRSNMALGGTAQKVTVPDDIKAYAVTAANTLGLDYCGIDFLLGDTPLLCEVNSNAFFDGFEKTTGINVAARYAEHIIKTVYKGNGQ